MASRRYVRFLSPNFRRIGFRDGLGIRIACVDQLRSIEFCKIGLCSDSSRSQGVSCLRDSVSNAIFRELAGVLGKEY